LKALPLEPDQELFVPEEDWLTVEGMERSLQAVEATAAGFSMDVAWGIEPGAEAMRCSGALIAGWMAANV
jgi:hypothetical protein